jgi:hypothetical protein
VAKREGRRATDLPGTLADFAVAGTPEPDILAAFAYRLDLNAMAGG